MKVVEILVLTELIEHFQIIANAYADLNSFREWQNVYKHWNFHIPCALPVEQISIVGNFFSF